MRISADITMSSPISSRWSILTLCCGAHPTYSTDDHWDNQLERVWPKERKPVCNLSTDTEKISTHQMPWDSTINRATTIRRSNSVDRHERWTKSNSSDRVSENWRGVVVCGDISASWSGYASGKGNFGEYFDLAAENWHLPENHSTSSSSKANETVALNSQLLHEFDVASSHREVLYDRDKEFHWTKKQHIVWIPMTILMLDWTNGPTDSNAAAYRGWSHCLSVHAR